MEGLDYWRLCEELNIVQAALLIVGENPDYGEYVEDWNADKRPDGYEAAKTAVCGGLKNFIRYEKECADLEQETANFQLDYPNALNLLDESHDYLSNLSGRSIEGTFIKQSELDANGGNLGFIEGTLDLYKSTVNAESLKQWLRVKGITAGFFFPEPVTTMDFLDPSNSRYAPKLAASVKAWQAVTDAGSKSPKKALEKWLRENASHFGLTNDEGNHIEQAIEECSKVANWNPKGGATKTPT
jgi:hypothetical protein